MADIKILVTGAAGFIPSSLIARLLEQPNVSVLGIDNLLTGNTRNINGIQSPNFSFIKADANNYQDLSEIMLYHKFDYVFHYAAVVGVARTLQYPLLVLEDISGIKNILRLSTTTSVKRVYFSSSSEVYGEPVAFPQNEMTTPLNSKLPYAIVKNAAEAFLKSYYHEHRLEYTIFRFFNTYGPNQSPDFVVSRFINLALKGKDIPIYGDGSQTRTFCYIQDNVDTTLKCLNDNLHVNDIINIGSSIETSVLELAQTIIKLTGSPSQIINLPPLPEGDMRRRCPDNAKMLNILKRPLIPLEEGLLRIIHHYKQ